MKLKHPVFQKTLGLLGSIAIRMVRSTIDYRGWYSDPFVDPIHPQSKGRYIYVGWHEYMLMPISLRGHRNMVALASEHGDGEIIARAMMHLNWKVARGSSSRGATSALLSMLRDDHRHLSFTPDGPRGPRWSFSLGALFLASKLNIPIVCVGYGYQNPWRMRSWDKFAVPKPFSRCRAVFSPPLKVPPRLNREQLELYRSWFERMTKWLTVEAETWAADGKQRPGELQILRGETPRAMDRWTPADAPPLPKELMNEWEELNGRPNSRQAA